MKKTAVIFSLLLTFACFGGTAHAQDSKTSSPEAAQPDPIREADAKHNLDVARQYYSPKKAYKAVLMRFEETFAAYPEFSKMDEFLFIAGMSSMYLSESKGPQAPTGMTEKEKAKYAPEKLKQDAIVYLSMIVDKYPKSKFRDDAEKTLKKLKG